MPTSRLNMENANGRWVVEFELGGIAARREHFSEADFLVALDRIKNAYLNSTSPTVAAEQEASHTVVGTDGKTNAPVFPVSWTAQQIADFHINQARKYGRPAPEQPAEAVEEAVENEDAAVEDADEGEQDEYPAAAEGEAETPTGRKQRKPRQFAAPAEGGVLFDR